MAWLGPCALAGVAVAQAAAPNGVIEGRVFGPLGEPVPAAEVRAVEPGPNGAELARSRTDGEGLFVLGHVPCRGDVLVLASSPGLTTGRAEVELRAEAPRTGVHLRLWDASTVRGRIVDAAGAPLAAAHVLATRDGVRVDRGVPELGLVCECQAATARTDADGRFELRGVPCGAFVLRAWAPGYVLRHFWGTTPADADVTLPLERGDRLPLVIECAGLAPDAAPRAEVELIGTSGGFLVDVPDAMRAGHCDALGMCAFAGLPDLDWHVEVRCPGHVFAPASGYVMAGKGTTSLRFQAISLHGAPLRGRLLDDNSLPIGAQTLVLRRAPATPWDRAEPLFVAVGADGRFACQAPLANGDAYTLQLLGGPFALAQSKDVGRGDRGDCRDEVCYRLDYTGVHAHELGRAEGRALDLELAARPAASVRARLRDRAGQPVPFQPCDLRYRASAGREWKLLATASSDRGGRVQFGGVHGGDRELLVTTVGFAGSGESAPFAVKAGAAAEVAVALQPPGRVVGTARRGEQPAAGVIVQLSRRGVPTHERGASVRVLTDRDGRFCCTGVAPGAYMLFVLPAVVGADARLDVAAGAVVEQDLAVPR